jgi:hypothetical protein
MYESSCIRENNPHFSRNRAAIVQRIGEREGDSWKTG